MARFRNAGEGAIGAYFEPEEVRVLAGLVQEMSSVLDSGSKTGDPITERLFPAAYEDPTEQRAYEELLGDQLKDQKVRALANVRDSLPSETTGELILDPDATQDWLTVINDIRLAIGTRLDVTEEVMQKDIDPDDPDGASLAVLHWLGWVQESFLHELNG
ncbi:MAG: hypothetical protein QOK47_75 [Actinomycetota bacterium]|nr:hypothetical protein [Actinomycetota bacterium]